MIPKLVYLLCALTSLVCTVLLLRRYSRTRVDLLFWSGVCFFALTVGNVLLFVDLVLVRTVDLSTLRTLVTLVGGAILLLALIRHSNPD